jgi:hypothetical protein
MLSKRAEIICPSISEVDREGIVKMPHLGRKDLPV